MLEVNFKVLKEINDNNEISQREISKAISVSLGKVNSVLKEFVDNGYMIKEFENNKFKYEVTDKGRKILEQNLEVVIDTKININKDKEFKMVNQAVILAAGRQNDFEKPIGMLSVGSELIVERTIRLLRENGIKKIVLITGYDNESFKPIIDKYDYVYEIENNEYYNTGTMKSLAKIQNIVKEDFLLIESDLVFENKAIKSLIANEMRDCVLITNISGIGDEAFVEIRNNYLYKMAKDIHQFNKIHGEFIGITKVSQKLFKLMLREIEDNENPMINYEYTLLDVARKYNVGYVKIDNLIWGEVDTLKQYKFICANILDNL